MDEIEQLRSDLENAVLERDKALAELDMFRAVVITAVAANLSYPDDMVVQVDGSYWVTLPLKVFVKDDHV